MRWSTNLTKGRVVIIDNLKGSRITWDPGLWSCLWDIILITLIDLARHILIVGGIILWHRTLDWLEQRKQAEKQHTCLHCWTDCRHSLTSCFKLLLPWCPCMMDCTLKVKYSLCPSKLIFFKFKCILYQQ